MENYLWRIIYGCHTNFWFFISYYFIYLAIASFSQLYHVCIFLHNKKNLILLACKNLDRSYVIL